MFSVISSTRAVDIKPGENLRDGLVHSKNNLKGMSITESVD